MLKYTHFYCRFLFAMVSMVLFGKHFRSHVWTCEIDISKTECMHGIWWKFLYWANLSVTLTDWLFRTWSTIVFSGQCITAHKYCKCHSYKNESTYYPHRYINRIYDRINDQFYKHVLHIFTKPLCRAKLKRHHLVSGDWHVHTCLCVVQKKFILRNQQITRTTVLVVTCTAYILCQNQQITHK